MSLCEEDVGDLGPLFTSRIHSSWVVRTSVKKENGLGRCSSEEGEIFREGESDRLGVVVRVVNGCAAYVGENRFVIGCTTGRRDVSQGFFVGTWKNGVATHPRSDC